ncbi:MAG TPA: OmpA family protein [Alphaproteobacteria bacterium]
MKRFGLIVACSLLAAACSGFSNRTAIDALNEAKPVGSAFTQSLSAGYKAFANSQQNRYFDYADALHFAKKGLLAAEGKNVLPEPMTNWHLDPRAHAELTQARLKLVRALDGGARTELPSDAANAQIKFDCWIEQQEESLMGVPSCKAEFEQALAKIQKNLKANLPPSAKAGAPLPAGKPLAPITNRKGVSVPPLAPVISQKETNGAPAPVVMDEGMFLVFYDFDRSTLNSSGLQVMDAVAKQLKSRKDIKFVSITGFTDTSGSNAYNQRLSQRRADAVRQALVSRGVPAGLLQTKAMGETQLMVKTPDNTREPANRRAEIRFD